MHDAASPHLKACREGKRIFVGVVFLGAHPTRAAEEDYRIEDIPAVHARGAGARLVGIEREESTLGVYRAPGALESSLVFPSS